MATKRKATKTRKSTNARKRISSKAVRIAIIGKSNPRREGTRAFKAVASMLKVTRNGAKKIPFADVMKVTKPTYRTQDRDWDVGHGFIKLVPMKVRAA